MCNNLENQKGANKIHGSIFLNSVVYILRIVWGAMFSSGIKSVVESLSVVPSSDACHEQWFEITRLMSLIKNPETVLHGQFSFLTVDRLHLRLFEHI